MALKFKSKYLIGIFLALALLYLDYYLFWDKRWFWPGVVIALNIGGLQFWFDFLKENKKQKEIELKFLEFTRALVSSVKSGIDIPKAILNVSNEDYGDLNPFVKKLANQIEWGIPVRAALLSFGRDTNNVVIKRAIAIVIEAEESGGDIGDVLDSVAHSVVNVKKMKEERRSSAYSQVVQGYIVFFVFIGIILVLQLWLFPMLSGLGEENINLASIKTVNGGINIDRIFLILSLIQGFFAGIMVGKFSEGTFKQGLIHSLVLMTLAALIITTATGGI